MKMYPTHPISKNLRVPADEIRTLQNILIAKLNRSRGELPHSISETAERMALMKASEKLDEVLSSLNDIRGILGVVGS